MPHPALARRAVPSADDGEAHLRRVVGKDGRSRQYVNGQALPAQSVRELGELLIDIHGQQEFQSLVRRVTQRALLDEHGGHAKESAAVRDACRNWRALAQQRGNRLQRRGATAAPGLSSCAIRSANSTRSASRPARPRTCSRNARVTNRGRLSKVRGRSALLATATTARPLPSRVHGPASAACRLDAALAPAADLLDEAGIVCSEAIPTRGPTRSRSTPIPRGRNWSKRGSPRSRPLRASITSGGELAALRERLPRSCWRSNTPRSTPRNSSSALRQPAMSTRPPHWRCGRRRDAGAASTAR